MKRVYDFLRLRWVMIAISLVLILGGVAGYFVRGGFNLGIDFTAGLVQQVQIRPGSQEVAIADARAALADIEGPSIQAVGPAGSQQFMIKVLAPSDDDSFQVRMEVRIVALLSEAFGADNVVIQQSDFVGPRYAGELGTQTISIVAVALALILIYTAFRFRIIYATAAVLCLVHDTLLMLGVIAVFRLEVTTSTIAAILTIIGYSLNDTIIIFDRVRENRGLMRDSKLVTIINTSISQSLSRTILTSVTTLLAIVTVYVLGSGDIKNFAFNLIIGIVIGTYSTVFIASPIALEWTRAVERRRTRRDIQRYGKPAGAGAAAIGAAGAGSRQPEGAAAQVSRFGEAEGPEGQAADAPARPPEPTRGGGPVQVTRVQPTRKKKKKR
jgi:preprotein translocase subunit SecF